MRIALSTSATGTDFDKTVSRTRDVVKDNGFEAMNPQLMAQVIDNPALAPDIDSASTAQKCE